MLPEAVARENIDALPIAVGRAVAKVPIPPPHLAEQTRIVAEVERRLSVVEELETLVQINLLPATRLCQSVLQQAFTGPAA